MEIKLLILSNSFILQNWKDRGSEMLGNFCLGSGLGEDPRIHYTISPISSWKYIYTYICIYDCSCLFVFSSEITFKDSNRMQCAWGLPNVTLLKIT